MAPVPLRDTVETIRRRLNEGALEQAVALAAQVLSGFPRHLQTHLLLAEARLLRGEADAAAELFYRVLSADPENVSALTGLAAINERDGRPIDALALYRRASELNPASAPLSQKIQELSPDHGGAPALNRTMAAHLYAVLGQPEQAIREYQTLLNAEPARLDLQVAFAQALFAAGRKREAESAAERLLYKLPFCLKANLILAAVWSADGVAESRALFDRARELDPDVDMAHALGITPPDAVAPAAVEQADPPAGLQQPPFAGIPVAAAVLEIPRVPEDREAETLTPAEAEQAAALVARASESAPAPDPWIIRVLQPGALPSFVPPAAAAPPPAAMQSPRVATADSAATERPAAVIDETTTQSDIATPPTMKGAMMLDPQFNSAIPMPRNQDYSDRELDWFAEPSLGIEMSSSSDIAESVPSETERPAGQPEPSPEQSEQQPMHLPAPFELMGLAAAAVGAVIALERPPQTAAPAQDESPADIIPMEHAERGASDTLMMADVATAEPSETSDQIPGDDAAPSEIQAPPVQPHQELTPQPVEEQAPEPSARLQPEGAIETQEAPSGDLPPAEIHETIEAEDAQAPAPEAASAEIPPEQMAANEPTDAAISKEPHVEIQDPTAATTAGTPSRPAQSFISPTHALVMQAHPTLPTVRPNIPGALEKLPEWIRPFVTALPSFPTPPPTPVAAEEQERGAPLQSEPTTAPIEPTAVQETEVITPEIGEPAAAPAEPVMPEATELQTAPIEAEAIAPPTVEEQPVAAEPEVPATPTVEEELVLAEPERFAPPTTLPEPAPTAEPEAASPQAVPWWKEVLEAEGKIKAAAPLQPPSMEHEEKQAEAELATPPPETRALEGVSVAGESAPLAAEAEQAQAPSEPEVAVAEPEPAAQAVSIEERTLQLEPPPTVETPIEARAEPEVEEMVVGPSPAPEAAPAEAGTTTPPEPEVRIDPEGLLQRARALTAAGDLSAAMDYYERAMRRGIRVLEEITADLEELAKKPDAPSSVHRLLGDAYAAAGRFQEAIVQYRWVLNRL